MERRQGECPFVSELCGRRQWLAGTEPGCEVPLCDGIWGAAMRKIETDLDGNLRKKIVVWEGGPYVVYGRVPLVLKEQIVSEYGEPLAWRKTETINTGRIYSLCRCGESREKPFCDGTHCENFFEGTETADTRPTAVRQAVYRGTGIVVKRDYTFCMQAGFCGNRYTNVEWLVRRTADTQVRAQVMAMIERCPSGSFTYTTEEGGPEVEPDLPQQVAVITEITSNGPIHGPLWVTGGVPIERADGQPFETRNRVTLCRCGKSKCKPLCDGTHRPQVG